MCDPGKREAYRRVRSCGRHGRGRVPNFTANMMLWPSRVATKRAYGRFRPRRPRDRGRLSLSQSQALLFSFAVHPDEALSAIKACTTVAAPGEAVAKATGGGQTEQTRKTSATAA